MFRTCSVFLLFAALLKSSSGSKWVCLRLDKSRVLKITNNNNNYTCQVASNYDSLLLFN